jgi:hypothetical protein
VDEKRRMKGNKKGTNKGKNKGRTNAEKVKAES